MTRRLLRPAHLFARPPLSTPPRQQQGSFSIASAARQVGRLQCTPHARRRLRLQPAVHTTLPSAAQRLLQRPSSANRLLPSHARVIHAYVSPFPSSCACADHATFSPLNPRPIEK
ncbi:hypothetical protein C8R45DRAFT_1102747 [Mycena sanguinolenta]|nr:hypothetical protein C8R45DRAFT_1102747 [Mycena sanguinolenta]